MAYEITEIKKIGIGLIGFGIFFAFLGIILFFDRGLLALGNIFSLAGVAILLGWRSTWALFTNRANFKGSASFLLGLFFICVRWPIVGIILEIYSCVFLFRLVDDILLELYETTKLILHFIIYAFGCSGFWSSIKVFLYHIPVVGWIIQFISPP
ncbi:Vesicle transport protein GOT1 isoform C [Glycine soja]|uniref:Vesicle transport protein GOT1 isoform B n=1 Tax=Glycine soja TaxID=3848 RepID=A0A445JQ41_GLYSO|nr:Vesicle transport protein GOT1 isoform B [Glycine soja]RZC00478.1 Vesicle transport protein GOT1 isoform C [Glycine soja]